MDVNDKFRFFFRTQKSIIDRREKIQISKKKKKRKRKLSSSDACRFINRERKERKKVKKEKKKKRNEMGKEEKKG